jgi:hypothetical protein
VGKIMEDELSELRELIKEHKRLIETYPDCFSLRTGLDPLEQREKELLLRE